MSWNLKKAIDEGGSYMEEGWHRVLIESYRTFEGKKNGTPGVEFQLRDDQGRQGKAVFFITEKAMWRIGKFAKAAGVSEHTLEACEPDDLIGKSLDVYFEKGEKYTEYKTCDPLGTHTGRAPQPTASNGKPAAVVAAVAAMGEVVADEDLPF